MNELITIQKGKRKYQYTQFQYDCAVQMYLRIKAVVPYTQEPNYADWANTLRMMVDKDGYAIGDIGNAFRWANQDAFWQLNILSPKSLRKNFPKIHAQMVKSYGNEAGQRTTTQRKQAIKDATFGDKRNDWTDIVR